MDVSDALEQIAAFGRRNDIWRRGQQAFVAGTRFQLTKLSALSMIGLSGVLPDAQGANGGRVTWSHPASPCPAGCPRRLRES
jgi:hypothetical protein